MTKIVLDAESFKALASDTRLQILRALDARPLTVSELSRLLDLNKATVFEHLKQLGIAELAKREEDPARKWVYYKLTWKGKNVLHPENAQIFIMLGLAALGFGGALLQSARLLRILLQSADESSQSAAPEAPAEDRFDVQREADSAPAASSSPQAASGAQTTSSAPAQENLSQEGAGGGAPQQPVQSDDSGSWFDNMSSSDPWILVAIATFLVLLTMLMWALYKQQRGERLRVLALIKQLPADVNDAEERSV